MHVNSIKKALPLVTYGIQNENRNKLDDAIESHVFEDGEISSKGTSPFTYYLRHTLDVVCVGGKGSSDTCFSF